MQRHSNGPPGATVNPRYLPEMVPPRCGRVHPPAPPGRVSSAKCIAQPPGVRAAGPPDIHEDPLARVTHSGNDVIFETRYRSLADEVPRGLLDGYLNKVDEVRQDDSLVFTSNDPAPSNQRTYTARRILTPG